MTIEQNNCLHDIAVEIIRDTNTVVITYCKKCGKILDTVPISPPNQVFPAPYFETLPYKQPPVISKVDEASDPTFERLDHLMY